MLPSEEQVGHDVSKAHILIYKHGYSDLACTYHYQTSLVSLDAFVNPHSFTLNIMALCLGVHTGTGTHVCTTDCVIGEHKQLIGANGLVCTCQLYQLLTSTGM